MHKRCYQLLAWVKGPAFLAHKPALAVDSAGGDPVFTGQLLSMARLGVSLFSGTTFFYIFLYKQEPNRLLIKINEASAVNVARDQAPK